MKVISVGSCGTEPVIVDATLPDGASSVVLCNVMFSFSVTAESLTSRLVLSQKESFFSTYSALMITATQKQCLKVFIYIYT